MVLKTCLLLSISCWPSLTYLLPVGWEPNPCFALFVLYVSINIPYSSLATLIPVSGDFTTPARCPLKLHWSNFVVNNKKHELLLHCKHMTLSHFSLILSSLSSAVGGRKNSMCYDLFPPPSLPIPHPSLFLFNPRLKGLGHSFQKLES